MLFFLFALYVLPLDKVLASSVNNQLDFKISEDYIYEIYPNKQERFLNPNSVILARNISFLQIKSSLFALKNLVLKLEQTCSEIKSLEEEGATSYDYEFLVGSFNVSTAKDTCETKGKKLIEVQTSDQLLVLLQRLGGKYMTSPAGTTFQPNISNFIFESNGRPFREGPITTAIFGNKMSLRYDSYLYRNYHLRYVFNGTKAVFEITPHSVVQKQIICMYKEIDIEDSFAASCHNDLLILENMFHNFERAIHQYLTAVNKVAILPKNSIHRTPRGLLSGIAIGAAVGGGTAGILTKLFSNSLSIEELEKSSLRTEKILGQLASRKSLLDVNQVMLSSAVNNASKLIRLGMFKDNIQSVKIHANSLSIFLEKCLELLQRLTGTPISSRSYLLSISLAEVGKLVSSLFPKVRPADIHDRNILYSFQTDGKQQLFLILQILIPNKLEIKQFIKAIPWPNVANNTLISRSRRGEEWFLLLSDENYIEISTELANQCMKSADKCTTNMVPKAIISGMVTHHIAQYFRVKETKNDYIELVSKLFLIYITKNTLIYTSLNTIEIRINCPNKKPQVSNLIGKGVLRITDGCEISSQFFTLNPPTQMGTLTYQNFPKLDDSFYTNVHTWNTSALNMQFSLEPVPTLETNILFKSSSFFDLPIKYFAIFAFILTIFCCGTCFCFTVTFCRIPISRSMETNV